MKKQYSILAAFTLLLLVASCTDENDPSNPNIPSDDRSRFTGNWTCAELGGQTFGISISTTGSNDTITINNFSNYGSSANALGEVNGNSLTIPGQNISVSSIFVQGSGVMNSAGNKITMEYIADGDTINATCTKN